jgi:hypothetical protein
MLVPQVSLGNTWTARQRVTPSFKGDRAGADTRRMIISAEQVRLATEYLRSERADEQVPAPCTAVAPDLVERVKREIEESPETREDRVASARESLDGGISSDEVADKLIGRVISDSLR